MIQMRKLLPFVFAMTVFSVGCAFAAEKFEDVFPAKPDPFVGDYVGRWSAEEEVNPDIAAQVIALGDNKYRIRLVSKLDRRCPPIAQPEVEAKNGKLSFDIGGLEGSTDGQIFTGHKGRVTFSMKRVERTSPTMGKQPPQNAVVLFDGKNLDAWQPVKGWKILDDGTLLVTPDGDYLVSKTNWKDCELHVEFRLPFMPRARGQARGNSGVFLQGKYEVQVLDTYGLEGYYDECGALYKLAAPCVNACYPPLAWQTYDITYHAPKYDSSGKLTENGRMTVYQNGILIHNNQELTWITDWKEKDRLAPAPKDPGPIKLQGHHNFVEFRNVWLVDTSGK